MGIKECPGSLQEALNELESDSKFLELLIARCPASKKLQDMAALLELKEVRFRPLNDDCILCGLCVRMCEEQMAAKAIGFAGRGGDRYINTEPVCASNFDDAMCYMVPCLTCVKKPEDVK